MNSLLIFVFSLLLLACANNNPGSRPVMYSKAERLMSNGVMNYKQDNFASAQQNFERALTLYQSVDNSEGVSLARINLLESHLAINEFSVAEQQLAILKKKNLNAGNDDLFNERIVLLEVKLLFKKQQYLESLALIEPLILIKQPGSEHIELLATAARLEALIGEEAEVQWNKLFRKTLLQENNIQAKYQVILKRIDAIIAIQNQQYQTALELLQDASDYYKEQANRRAIANCLEEMADVEFKLNNQEQALRYLERALSIRVWLKDQHHINKIQKRMIAK